MNRRDLLKGTAFGILAAIPLSVHSETATKGASPAPAAAPLNSKPLKPPADAPVDVAFLISDGAVVIDFCGPWEVFQDVGVAGRRSDAFRLYTVAETSKPIRASAGMKIIPDYTFATAPAPKVIVIPAQNGQSPATLDWIRKSSKTADITMSVCTGAFLLAKTGLLSGKSVTTHHSGYVSLSKEYPDINVKRGVRFVEDGAFASAGGLSCGIDLALRVVERYYGTDVAKDTAYGMEYQGQGWMNPGSNAVYAEVHAPAAGHSLCPVCQMEVDPATALKSLYKGKAYYFCSQSHKDLFDQSPEKFMDVANK